MSRCLHSSRGNRRDVLDKKCTFCALPYDWEQVPLVLVVSAKTSSSTTRIMVHCNEVNIVNTQVEKSARLDAPFVIEWMLSMSYSK